MADLAELDRANIVKIAGADPATGITDNYMQVDPNGTGHMGIYNASGSASDFNYGTVSSTTLRTAAQIGNSLGPADFGTGSATAQTLRVALSNFPITLDTNYGAVGASTLRTASQIGNATGAADFAAGNTSAQTLRVVISTNQSAIPVTGTFFQATQPISAVSLPLPTGASTSALQTTGNTSLANILTTLTRAQGSATAGQTGPLILAAVTTAAPTYTTAQSSPLSLTTTGLLRVDGSGVTQPVSIASLPLPTGAATSALQTTGNVSLASINTKTPSLGQALMEASTPVVIASDQSAIPVTGTFFQATQPVSGTVTANQGTSPWVVSGTVTATNPSVSTTGTAPPASATYIGGSVTTAAPSYTTGQMNALSLTTTGLLRVDGSGVTQPVSGTVAATQSGAWTVAATQSGVWTTGRTWTLASGTDSVSSVQSGTWNIGTLTSITNPVAVTQSTSPWVVSGTVTATNPSVSTTGTAPPASATYIGGSVTTAAPTYTTGQMNALSLTTTGLLRVDGSGVTQPVSGTVAATQSGAWSTGRTWTLASGTDSVAATQSGTWNIGTLTSITNPVAVTGTFFQATQPVSAVSLPLPTGASTSALQTTGNASLASIDSKTPALGQALAAASVPVVLTAAQLITLTPPTTVAVTQSTSPWVVSGTVTATNPSVSTTGTAPPASATYIGGSVTTAAPSYTTGQMNALSLTTTGLLRVDGSGVTQPVSGTVAATQSGAWTTGRTWTLASGTDSIASVQSGTWNITNISGTVSLPTGAATSALQTTGNTSLASILSAITLAQGSTTSGQTGALTLAAVTTAAPSYTTGQTNSLSLNTSGGLRVDGSGVTQPISGTVAATQSGVWTVAATQSGTWNVGTVTSITNPVAVTQSTSPWVVSGTVTATNPSVSTTGTAPPASATYIGGSVTTAAPSYTTGQMNALSLTTTGLLRVDGSGVTQPVSGTVAATQSGAWTTGRTWTLASGTDSISAVQSGTWTVQPGNTANTTPWLVTDSSDGPVAPGAVAGKSSLAGGQFNTALPTLTNTQQSAIQLDSSGRLIIRPLTSTDVITANQGTANTIANAWPIKITDGTNTAAVTANSDQKVSDGLRNGGTQSNLSVPTANTAVEVKVGGARLANRKSVTFIPIDADMFWGYDNTVTTSNGTPLKKNQFIEWSCDPGSTFQIWVVCATSAKNGRTTESA